MSLDLGMKAVDENDAYIVDVQESYISESVPSRGKKCAGARPFAGPTAHPFPNTSHICRFMTVGTM